MVRPLVPLNDGAPRKSSGGRPSGRASARPMAPQQAAGPGLQTTLPRSGATVADGANSVNVTTTNGTVSGEVKDGVAAFMGIPFAASPIGALRFRGPAAHAGWSGVRDGTVGGAVCTQGAGASPPPSPPHPAPPGCAAWCSAHHHLPDSCGCGVCGSFGGCSFSCTADNRTRFQCPGARRLAPSGRAVDEAEAEAAGTSEDCLFINAFTPLTALDRGPTDPLLPIMFYIHGGGFIGGSAVSSQNMTATSGHIVFAPQCTSLPSWERLTLSPFFFLFLFLALGQEDPCNGGFCCCCFAWAGTEPPASSV